MYCCLLYTYAVATFVLSAKFKVGAIKLILIMGVLGAIFCSGMIG